MSDTVPVHVIGGFLGSGKTTLLKRLLRHELARGRRPAVIMNEFGEVDVDSRLLHDHEARDRLELESLASGCVCCDLSGELESTLRKMLTGRGAADPIFIEATGLASIAQVVTGVERALGEQPGARLGSVIAVVDGARQGEIERSWGVAGTQFDRVDTVVINKMDLASEREARRIEGRVRAASPRARLLRARYAEVPPEEALAAPARAASGLPPDGELIDSTAGFQSLAVRVGAPLDLQRVESLLRRYPRSVVRLKGFVRATGRRGLQEIQWVPGSFESRPAEPTRGLRAHLVVIGRRLAWERFLDGLDACAVPPARRSERRAKG